MHTSRQLRQPQRKRRQATKILVSLGVFGATLLCGVAYGQVSRVASLLAQEQRPDCVLANPRKVVCYIASTREMYLLLAKQKGTSARLLTTLPDATPLAGLNVETKPYLWGLSAQEGGVGDLLIAWQYSRNNVSSINLARLGNNGEFEHRVVKEFKPHEPLFDLRTFVVESNVVQFFYTYYSEKTFSPILDAGSIQKLWTLRWRNGHILYDSQLSEKGPMHTTRYDVTYRGQGKFDVAWLEERIGSFRGPRRTFNVGNVSVDPDTAYLMKLGEIAVEELEPQDKTLMPIVVQSSDLAFKALASVSYGKDGALFKRLAANGKLLGEIRVLGSTVAEFGYDTDHPPLFRYVKGLVSGSSSKAEVHWTDFEKYDRRAELEVPRGSIFPRQTAANCLFWLQPTPGSFDIRKICRPQARER